MAVIGCHSSANQTNKPKESARDQNIIRRLEIIEESAGLGDRRKVKEETIGLLQMMSHSPKPTDVRHHVRIAAACEQANLPANASDAYDKAGDLEEALVCAIEAEEYGRADGLRNRIRAEKPAVDSAAAEEEQLSQFDKSLKNVEKALGKKELEQAKSEMERALQLAEGLNLSTLQQTKCFTLKVETAYSVGGREAGQSATKEVRSTIKSLQGEGTVKLLQIRQAQAWIERSGEIFAGDAKELAVVMLTGSFSLLDDAGVSKASQINLADAPLHTAYQNSEFEEAISYLSFRNSILEEPRFESKRTLIQFAAKRAPKSLFGEPFPFSSPKKAQEATTAIYFWDPSGRHVRGRLETYLSEPDFRIETEAAKPNGVKINVWDVDRYTFLFEFSTGFRLPFAPGHYDRVFGVKAGDGSPRLALYKGSPFERAQYIVYEVSWKSEERKELVRFAADFVASMSGDMNELCFGSIRYNSTVK